MTVTVLWPSRFEIATIEQPCEINSEGRASDADRETGWKGEGSAPLPLFGQFGGLLVRGGDDGTENANHEVRRLNERSIPSTED